MNGYYFEYQGITLARIWADNETQAKEKALIDHAWCGVQYTSELTLVRVNSQTIWDQPLTI